MTDQNNPPLTTQIQPTPHITLCNKALVLHGILLMICEELDYDPSNWLLIRAQVKKAMEAANAA